MQMLADKTSFLSGQDLKGLVEENRAHRDTLGRGWFFYLGGLNDVGVIRSSHHDASVVYIPSEEHILSS